MNNKEKKITHCIKLIKLAFETNMKAHKYSELSQHCYLLGDYDNANDYSCLKSQEYIKKSSILEKIINYIKKYSLPIKYGMNEGVVYFAYNGEQVSFHTFRNEKKRIISRTLKSKHSNCKPKIKAYNGNWKGTKNLTFPLNFKI